MLYVYIYMMRNQRLTRTKNFYSCFYSNFKQNIPNGFVPFIVIVVLSFFRISLFSQSKSLQVTIDKISTIDTVKYRNLSAAFPYPVLAQITVQDEKNRYVHGLADTVRWLSAQDLNQNGNLVGEVWSKLFERHEEDITKPANPDIKQTQPGYQVTEVGDAELSSAIVMDYSGSMIYYFNDAEIAAKEFVRNMRKKDRASVIKFSGDVYVLQDFTSDTTLLRTAIDKDSTSYSGTSIYDAIYQGITLTLNQPGRRVVIAYTDGRDHEEGHTIEEVIEYAQKSGIPVFTIGLFGNGPQHERLQRIADQTGGSYSFAPTATDLKDIYRSIYGIIRGYYVLAYHSPDPFFNGTWRNLSASVNYKGSNGMGTGRYFCPFIAPNLQIQMKAKTDSVINTGGVLHYYVVAGDTVVYNLKLFNTGLGQANQIAITNVFPDSVHPVEFSVVPQKIQPDTLSWFFPYLNPGDSLEIEYRARVNSKMPYGTTELNNTVTVSCYRDSIQNDNSANAVVNGLGIPDFIVRCIAPKSRISPGYPVPVSAVIENHGNADVSDPFSVGFFIEGYGTQPVALNGVQGLPLGKSVKVESQLIFPQTKEYIIRAVVDVKEEISELNESNNIDSSKVDAGIDSIFARINGISLKDTVQGTAGAFPRPVLTRVLVVDQNDHPVHGLADTSKWAGLNEKSNLGPNIGIYWNEMKEYHEENPSFPVSRNVREGLKLTEVVHSPVSPFILMDYSETMQSWIARVRLKLNGYFDRFGSGDQAAVAGLKGNTQLFQPFTRDQSLLKQAIQQSCTGKTRPLYDALYQSVEWGSAVSGRKSVVAFFPGLDQGSVRTCSAVVRYAQDKGVPIFVILLQAAAGSDSLRFIAEETGGWFFSVQNDSTFNNAVDRTDEMLRNHYVLAHTTSDTLQDQTWRTVEVGLSAYGKNKKDKGLYHVPQGFLNAAVEVRGRGTEWTTVSRDTAWFVRTNERASYRMTVRNIGHQNISRIQLESLLPQNLIPDQTGVYTIHGDTVRWIFPSLPMRSTIQVDLNCRVDTVFTTSNLPLINRTWITIPQDWVTKDNSDADTLIYIPLKLPDLFARVRGAGDSISVIRRDTLRYTHPGKAVKYTVSLVNLGEIACRNILVRNVIPDRVSLVGFSGASFTQRGDTLLWSIDRIESRGANRKFVYTCKVDTFMPPWETALVNQISTTCQQDSDLKNNAFQDTVWAAGIVPPNPEIRVSPVSIEPRDTISVEVQSPIRIKSWDVRIVFENGEQIQNYADPFILTTSLSPGLWVRVAPSFEDTRMRTANREERVAVVLQTIDFWDVVRTDTTYFLLRSTDEFYLERNVFRPQNDGSFGIRFKLSSTRPVDIEIYDIAGGHVKKVADGLFPAGWNQTMWDGMNERNEKIGSGVYVAVLSSSGFKKALKFILVR